MLLVPLVLLSLSWSALATVTVYGQEPLAATLSAPGSTYTGLAAYDPTVLNPPPVPNPPPASQYALQLSNSADSVQNLSIPHSGSFFGFSIETSVINQVLGKNSSFIQVPFLNLISNHVKRSGEIHIRIGGNTQDYATMVDTIADGKIIEKLDPTASTPSLVYTRDVFYMMSNVSEKVNVKWYLGIPFNDTSNLRLQIAEESQKVLGNKMLGYQIGNEPDLLSRHGHRSPDYTVNDYFNEFGSVVNAVNSDSNVPTKNNFIGPSISASAWSLQQVWDTGYITTYAPNLFAISAERYPSDNCYVIFPGTTGLTFHDPQTIFADYLSHDAATGLVSSYLPSIQLALGANKPFIMFETNTASCGGFKGISDSFGAALWALDYGLQMAAVNFAEALLHVSGQGVYYNPFTAPPTGESEYHQWTVGSIFYSTLVVAEAFGQSGTARIVDIAANSGNTYTPGYAIYENDGLSKVVLINFITDPTGASDSYVTISVGGGQSGQPNSVPAQAYVKYLAAPSVSEKTNITWAGQTFGGKLVSDGQLRGTETVITVPCDQNANTCVIHVPAPGAALVFFSTTDNPTIDPAQTYATTAYTQTYNTIRADPSAVAISNGHNGKDRQNLGSTSVGSKNGATKGILSIGLLAGSLLSVGAMIFG